MPRLHLPLVVVALLGACGPGATVGGGGDPVQRWPDQPDAVLAEVAAMTDPVSRLAVVIAVTEAHPGTTQALCQLLPPGPDQARCDRLNLRPHLQGASPAGGAPAGGTPGAPSGRNPGGGAQAAAVRAMTSLSGPGIVRDLVAQAPPADPWAEQPVVETACADAADPRACTNREAAGAMGRGEPAVAAATCRGLPDARWRQECFFFAAENPLEGAIGEPGARGAGPRDLPLIQARAGHAVSLCLGSGDFLAQCLRHVAGHVARLAPPAQASQRAAWQPLVDTIGAAVSTLAGHDPALADAFADQSWALATWRSQATASEACGTPLDLLVDQPGVSPWLAAHLRAAVVARLWNDGQLASLSLDRAAEQVREALASRPVSTDATRPEPGGLPLVDRWQRALPLERALTRIHHLSVGSRAVDSDPDVDLGIVLLEQAAATEPPHGPWLVEGLGHHAPVVRWTAVRLSQDLGVVGDGQVDALRADPDPMVAARAAVSARQLHAPAAGRR